MVFTCGTSLDSLEDAWQFMIWLWFALLFYGTITKIVYDSVHYGFMYAASKSIMLREWLYRILFLGTLTLASYAAWRIWSCSDWSNLPVRLFLYMLWFIVVMLIHPIFFLAESLLWNAVIFGCSFGMSLVILIMFIIRDLWAGVAFIGVSVFFMVHFFIHIYLFVNYTTVTKTYVEVRDAYYATEGEAKDESVFKLNKRPPKTHVKHMAAAVDTDDELNDEDRSLINGPGPEVDDQQHFLDTADKLTTEINSPN